jgi:hypothetical protein
MERQRHRFVLSFVTSIFDNIDRYYVGKKNGEALARRARQRVTNRYSAVYKPNGEREVARRKRQIEAGSLRVENGLAS